MAADGNQQICSLQVAGRKANERRRSSLVKTEIAKRRSPMTTFCMSTLPASVPKALITHPLSTSNAKLRTPRCASSLPPALISPSRGMQMRKQRNQSHVVCMAPDEERLTRRNPLDFPIEWDRPKPGRRPDIFPQFSPMKTPLPPPMPYDPPEEDEEEEEKKEEEEEVPDQEESDQPERR